MIETRISFDLPPPWSGEKFELDQIGQINYLVGPNGSGKSRFADQLRHFLTSHSHSVRFLNTDRLREMANPVTAYFGDSFSGGYARNHFSQLRSAGLSGSGVDTIVLLEDRLDLRIQVEATLSNLFGRDVVLEWDSGNLVPKVLRKETGESYRLDREECHGIKELFVLLTHLYDKHNDYLIIDEPELNLHPQYQAFFMQEVRRVTARPSSVTGNTKILFLITHSPFVLDLRAEDDLGSVVSFDLEYSVPKQVARESPNVPRALLATGRLNAHHKQLFFCDDPIFVEGRHDALMVEALMEARGVSAPAAGSCVIDCGGVGEVTHYLELCRAVGKRSHFVFDLDSLFIGRLRSCISHDNTIRSFLASAGVGGDFAKYVGALDRRLTELIDALLGGSIRGELEALGRYLGQFGSDRREWDKEQLGKARVAVMTAISLARTAICLESSEEAVQDVEGRWKRILATLARKNIHVLPGGALERYLPGFSGDRFDPRPEAKGSAVEAELRELQRIRQSSELDRDAELACRYGDLYEVVRRLPTKTPIDFDGVLREYISDYVHEVQKAVLNNSHWERDMIDMHMQKSPLQKSGVVALTTFRRRAEGDFEATISIEQIIDEGRRCLEFNSETTIGNMGEFHSTD